ncbi:restriction endonuclease subunit S [Pseudomonas protegens]|uniref:Restriction endonuclease subunit S n=1 Tax=Pseudomonas allii TaxID=2740531 RepID=A0A7Y8UTT5_9PSED|nr:restriction endonuclease subunit S [Pseudomonas allii]NWN46265.1 restriction endonuclease subunit S [Pseudomonas allii]NWN61971.1 restriction endonuclease subunit S [Pseudomonas allii]
MELKAGYKQTEVGVIPDDWSTPCLGQLIHSVEYGSSAKSRPNGKIPVLRMGNLRDGGIDWRGLVFTNNDAEIKKYLLRPGDVLFNRTNTIDLVGKTAIYKGERSAIFAGYLIRINENKSLLDSRFLNYVLNAEFSKKYSLRILSVAVGQANINGKKLKTYPVPLPPTLVEQQAIAQALGDTDVLIESLEQLLTKKREIKQGAMQELLNGERRLPGFSGEWEEKRLFELAEMGSGGTPLSSVAVYYDGDIPWVSISDMTKGGKLIKSTERNLSALGLAHSAARIFPAGTVLYAMYASLGECSVAGVPVCTSQAILGIRAKANMLDSEFLYHYLISLKAVVKELGQQGTQSNLNKGMVQNFSLRLPSLAEQKSIVSILSEMDDELNIIETKLQKARHLKQGVMQELLTGRIRLV